MMKLLISFNPVLNLLTEWFQSSKFSYENSFIETCVIYLEWLLIICQMIRSFDKSAERSGDRQDGEGANYLRRITNCRRQHDDDLARPE